MAAEKANYVSDFFLNTINGCTNFSKEANQVYISARTRTHSKCEYNRWFCVDSRPTTKKSTNNTSPIMLQCN